MDAGFRHSLFAQPDAALTGYDLTTVELAALRAIDFETLDAFAGILDERVAMFSALKPTDPPHLPRLRQEE